MTGDCAAVSDVAGVRVITLDSLVPGQGYGRLGRTQLDWLCDVLAQPAPGGSVVVPHHPPISVSAQQAAAGLQDPSALALALTGSDVHVVLCGHFHAQLTGRLGGVTVWVGPGVVSRNDLTAPASIFRAVRGAAATVLDLGGPASPLIHVLHARDPRVGELLYLRDPATWQEVATEEDPTNRSAPRR